MILHPTHMNRILKYCILFILIGSCSILKSQDDGITICATGYGENMDQAITASVRSALEQTFGVFLTSDTRTEINESTSSELELSVVDEMASLTNGNIVSYEVISSGLLETGEAMVTTRCTIALEPMQSFVQSKGHSATFSGGLFGRAIKLRELNILAEDAAMQDLVDMTRLMLATAVDFDVAPGDPQQSDNDWILPLTIKCKWNSNFTTWKTHFIQSLEGMAMDENEIEDFQNSRQDVVAVSIADGKNFLDAKYQKLHFRNPKSIAHLLDVCHVIGQALINFDLHTDVFDLEGPECWDMVVDVLEPKPVGYWAHRPRNPHNYLSGYLGVVAADVSVGGRTSCNDWSFSIQILDFNRPDNLNDYSLVGKKYYNGVGYSYRTTPSMDAWNYFIGSMDRAMRRESHQSQLGQTLGCDPTKSKYGVSSTDEKESAFFWNLGDLSRGVEPESDFQLALFMKPLLPLVDLERITEIHVHPGQHLKLQ